jgi:hypothetical protein
MRIAGARGRCRWSGAWGRWMGCHEGLEETEPRWSKVEGRDGVEVVGVAEDS